MSVNGFDSVIKCEIFVELKLVWGYARLNAAINGALPRLHERVGFATLEAMDVS